MNSLSAWACQFGSLVERRKVALLSAVFLAFPLAAVILSFALPDFGPSIFSFACHQNPERSLHVFGTMPLCARCFGLYLGFGLAGLFAPAFSLRFSKRFLLAGIFTSLGLVGLRFVFPALDANYLRLLLGLSVGAGLALLIKSVLK